MACCSIDRFPVDLPVPSVRGRKSVPLAVVSVSVPKTRRYRSMKAVHLFSPSCTGLISRVKKHSECSCWRPADGYVDDAVSKVLLWKPAQRSIGSIYYILFTSCCYAFYTMFSKHVLKLWAVGWKTATSEIGTMHMLGILAGHSLLYQFYNKDAFRIIFDTPAESGSILGSAIAITGIFWYSREICVISSNKCDGKGVLRHSSWFL